MKKTENTKSGCCSTPVPKEQPPCCCSSEKKEKQPPSASCTMDTAIGCIPTISSKWSWSDRWGQIKCRIGGRRDDYKVLPGLYAIGTPNENSDVFVTANYKLTFDILRKDIKGMDAWILALDTKGINVWCAAGKGSFGTEELVKRIKKTNLKNLIKHNKLIVPQLGAVGVSAHKVTEKTGFKVIYGPIKSGDIKNYVENNYSATEEMRRMNFPLKDRLVLVPVEFFQPWKKFLWLSAFTLLIFGLQPNGIIFSYIFTEGLPIVILGAVSIIAGALLVPALLPILPSRSFAIKGFTIGLITPIIALLFSGYIPVFSNVYIIIFCWILYPIISSYIGLQFTGASTFTNMSGVKKELKIGLPIYLISVGFSIILVILFKLSIWRVL
jgi:hypothetical protein